MNLRILFVVVAVFALVSCANAILINTTVISDVTGMSVLPSTVFGAKGTFTKTADAGYGLQDLVVDLRYYGDTQHIVLTHGNAQQTEILFAKTDLNAYSELVTATFTGGSASEVTYYKFFSLGVQIQYRLLFTVSNDTPKTYYAVFVPATSIIQTNLARTFPFDIDTDSDCYIVLPLQPSVNPVIKFSVTSNSNNDIGGTYAFGQITALKASELKPSAGREPLGSTDDLISMIVGVYTKLTQLAINLFDFINIFSLIFYFIFAGEIFIGMNAFYIAIAILLSIEDSDDLFKAFGNFYKRMMKLFRFYMELFRAMKDTLKWW